MKHYQQRQQLQFELRCFLGVIAVLTILAVLGAFSLTSLTLVPQLATRIHGSSRWLALGSLGVQPSEFLKWALLLYVASLLARHWYQKGSLIRTIMPISVITGLSALVLLRQPDFGLTVTLCTTII